MNNYYVSSFKYGNTKTEVDGIKFDSKKEANRYKELKQLEKQGEISELELQKVYQVIPTQRDSEGSVIERSANYIADFTYRDKEGNLVVEDVKGYKTPEYALKRKLMLHVYGIRILES